MLTNSLPSGASSSPAMLLSSGVDPAPFAEAGEGFGRRRDALRQGGLRAEGGGDAHPQLGGVRQQVIAVGKPREVSVHAEPAGKGDDDVKEHQRQRQRQNGQHRLAAAAAEVGPRHPGKEKPAVFLCLPALFAGVGRPFGVPHRLDRRNAPGESGRTPAGDEDGEEGEHRGKEEDDGVCRRRLGRNQLPRDRRGDEVADHPPDQQPRRQPRAAEDEGLQPHHPPQLPPGRADRL